MQAAVPGDGGRPEGDGDRNGTKEDSKEEEDDKERPKPELYGEDDRRERAMDMREAMRDPKDESWMWEPPFPCYIEFNNSVVYTKMCVNDFQCNMGPVKAMIDGAEYTVKMCAVPGSLLLYHACEVSTMDKESGEKMVWKDQACPLKSECNIGPLHVQTGGYDVEAKYCSGLAYATAAAMENKTKDGYFGKAGSACRLEDEHGT